MRVPWTPRSRRRSFIESYEFPLPFREALVRELPDRRAARIALDGLRAWYLVCSYAGKRPLGMPSRLIDSAWHEMILFTVEYHAFCSQAFGRYLHHRPAPTLRSPMTDLLARTLAIVDFQGVPMLLFTADADAGFPDGCVWDAAALRRLRDIYASQDAAEQARWRGDRGGWRPWHGDGDAGDGGGDGGGCGGGCGS